MNSVYAILPAAGKITNTASLVIYPVNSLDAGTDSLIGNVQYRLFFSFSFLLVLVFGTVR